MVNERRMELVFIDTEVSIYDRIVEKAAKQKVKPQELVKKIIASK